MIAVAFVVGVVIGVNAALIAVGVFAYRHTHRADSEPLYVPAEWVRS